MSDTRLTIRLTPSQLECVLSVVELTLDGSNISFGAWLTANPDKVSKLRAGDRELRRAEKVAKP